MAKQNPSLQSSRDWLVTLMLLAAALQVAPDASASTGAWAGTVTEVASKPEKPKDNLARFTARIDYLDYISWKGYGRGTKIGETATTTVRTRRTVSMLNGELVANPAFAEALRPGMWGYIYESTWINLYTLPEHRWGEVVEHDPAKRQLSLRIHRTHKDHHIDANPPTTVKVSYDADTVLRIADKPAEADQVFAAGNWVQIHPPRPQIIGARTSDAAYDPGVWLPHNEGRRGFANDLTAPAIVRGYSIGGEGVIDVQAKIEVTRYREGAAENITLRCRKVTFILDGKVAPPHVALRPGRHVVLGHYRSETSPHKVFVRSPDHAIRGRIASVAEGGASVTVDIAGPFGNPTGRTETVAIGKGARCELNGQPVETDAALKAGHTVTIYPQRKGTIIAFPPGEDSQAFKPGDAVEGSVLGRRVQPIRDRRMTRFDLDLNNPLQGPTRVSHRDLFVSLTTRNGEAQDITIVNFAEHAGGPAWVSRVVDYKLTHADNALRGHLTVDIDPRPKDRPAPVTGGRYHMTLDAAVRANHVAGDLEVKLDGKTVATRRFVGEAVALPWTRPRMENAVYQLTLDDPRQRISPIQFHLEMIDGEFIDGVAAGQALTRYDVDVSNLRRDGTRIIGNVTFTVPPQHSHLNGEEPVQAQLYIDVEAGAGGHVGKFKGQWGKADRAAG